ncbi:hypothetical protein H257_01382 [Aphanomyces astaci]|uniref:Uncharacterized protein n=1 Tax=Aphanomyces astaci TaxID=112090 RepID=W4H7H7_APHAT|nr:hypothetical protein H257_01382 [Aphanomyces astaci]ETV87990.1 hypothetical protein H257_01382 [Aphanomyces astaci]|eukprot:XP_009822853.1 hypothetical protein H257_01382 [Aphanomyces astaci]
MQLEDDRTTSWSPPLRRASASVGAASVQHERIVSINQWWSALFVKGKLDQLKQSRKPQAPVNHTVLQQPLSTTFKVYFPKLDYTAAY